MPPADKRLRTVIDRDAASARDARPAHAASHDRGVAGHAAAGGQDAAGGVHAVDVLGAGLDAHQDDRLTLLRAAFRLIGGKHDGTRGGAGAGRQSLGQQRAVCLRIQHRMQQLVERCRVHPPDRLGLIDQSFAGHVHRDPQRRRGGAFAVARLQHVQLVLLDRELEVLHVVVVLLEPLAHLQQFRIRLGHRRFQRRLVRLGTVLRYRLRRADARHHILALRVHQILAVEHVLAGGRIAGEADAGGAVVAHVAEHHGLHVHRGAPFGGNVVQLAVGDRAMVHPGTEHRTDRAPELFLGVLRKRLAGLALDQVLVALRDAVPVLRRELGILGHAGVELCVLDDLLEPMMIDPQHHRAVHLDESTVGVPGEARVVRRLAEAFHGHVVQPQVENGIHHPGHRYPCAGADRDQQRLVLVAELQRLGLLQLIKRLVDLPAQVVRVFALVLVERGADLGGEREAWRDRQADAGHLGQVGALAAEQVAHVRAALVVAGAKAVHPFCHCKSALDFSEVGNAVHR